VPPVAAAATLRRVPAQLVNFRKIPDPRGNLTPVEGERDVPFPIRRVYWIYDVPGGAVRGGHAYRTLEEVFVALSGSFDLTVDDGRGSTIRQTLNRGYYGVYVPAMMWRRLSNFSTNAVCLIFASRHYDEGDYVRDYDTFLDMRGTATR
jgi:oxalate decarboxylase/phosphoglucose isomerase-like protein (cupin superfamily)